MQTFLTIALYAGVVVLVVVLAAGIINLARSDEHQASRSNKLMRLRIFVQAAVIAILVALGVVAGGFSFGF